MSKQELLKKQAERRTQKKQDLAWGIAGIILIIALMLGSIKAWETEQNWNETHTVRYGSITE